MRSLCRLVECNREGVLDLEEVKERTLWGLGCIHTSKLVEVAMGNVVEAIDCMVVHIYEFPPMNFSFHFLHTTTLQDCAVPLKRCEGWNFIENSSRDAGSRDILHTLQLRTEQYSTAISSHLHLNVLYSAYFSLFKYSSLHPSTSYPPPSSYMAPTPASTPPNVTTFSVERTELPQWVSRDLNVSPQTVAMLEVNSSNMSLYATLVRYLAHRAVDISEIPPKLSDRIHSDPRIDEREWPGVLTSVLNPGSPLGWESYNSDDETVDASFALEKVSYGIGLGWARILTNPRSSSSAGKSYSKSTDEEEQVDIEEEDKKHIEEVMDAVNGSTTSATTATTTTEVVDSNGTTGNGDAVNRNSNGSTVNGLGELSGEDQVIIEHFGYGEPEQQHGTLTQYRQLIFYASDPRVLRHLLYDTMRWKAEHKKNMIHAKPGNYVLYTLKVFSNDNPPRWMCSGLRLSRPLSSIILADNMMQEIIDDLTDFLDKNTQKWYQAHGLAHRRNLLFYGLPGSGKTSTIKVS